MVRRSGWSIVLAASVLVPPPAQARDERFAISLPAGNPADILEALSAQTGVSFVYDVRLPAGPTRAARGRMSVREALDRILQGTPVHAVRIGPRAFRIAARPRPPRRVAPPAPLEPMGAATLDEEIVVTARKLPEALSSIAGAIAVYVPRDPTRRDRATRASDVARTIEGLNVANGGLGRERPFIRGLADSPFNGFSQSTVSVQIDEGRVTYDAAEPGLYLTDIARVEVLKGPQGPLYGTGALGGVYRIVTNRPVIGSTSAAATLGTQKVGSGGVGASAEAMLNLPLVSDRAALRLVGYARSDAGWVDDANGPSDVNRTRIAGGRAALRVAPATGWTADLIGAYQLSRTADSQYVDRDYEDLTRNISQREPRQGAFGLAQGIIAGPIGALRLTAVTSHAWQDQHDVFDASTAAVQLGVPGALRYRDGRTYRVLDQEVRLASAPGSAFTWTAGVSYISAVTRATGTVETATGTVPDYFVLHRRVTETSLFADGAYPLTARLKLAIGMRLFRATTEDERQEELDARKVNHAVIGFTPSASLSYQLADDRLLYVRLGTAYRPGGIDPSNSRTGRYVGDSVRSIEAGGRASFDGGRLDLAFAGFHVGWHNIQSDYLETAGLVATHNAGDAMIFGVEGSASWRPGGGWQLRGGFTIQRPRLINAADGTRLPRDRRLPVVPDLAGDFTIARALRLFGHEVTPYAALNYVGASRLSFDDGLDRGMGDYALARIGVTTMIGPFTLALDLDNALDARADSFAYGNPFSIRSEHQYTPLRPRTFSLSLSRSF
ncbi:MAG: TonB-dependent receptor [Sphingomonas sp.]|uniref:TonB-dependent receptor domain-containing protein n=1 Tax=unclassified Sphingomonas TaxID=196159 RepID=UPI002456767D|nr:MULTISPECIES: TonB-dependent receptor [unclassified Sphingomonas]MBQ1499699.1 TonB-dependent receptor [Sphingomonas sp.]MDH4743931.1 TonB-dependent receptor [Sphingomonas sp. CBMAI 2297]